jgi:hypothetical protein
MLQVIARLSVMLAENSRRLAVVGVEECEAVGDQQDHTCKTSFSSDGAKLKQVGTARGADPVVLDPGEHEEVRDCVLGEKLDDLGEFVVFHRTNRRACPEVLV